MRIMKLSRQSVLEDIASPPSLYDAAEEAEPWFLPPDDPVDDLPPLPRSERGRIFDPADWFAAQGALSGDLAAAVLVQGRLAERMAGAGEGARLRLALEEVAELGWWTGARFGMERLALYVALRVGAGEDGLALGQAAWAVRRLTAGAEPGAGGWRAGLAAFLGFEGEAVESLAEVMAGTEALHPLTRAALLLHGWGLAGENRAARDLEAAVLAALMLLDRVALWQRKADTALADLSGKTPRALVEVFARWPMVSAPMAEEHTQASRAAVQRNLDLMTQRGVIREITGQGRYRVWTAQL